MVETTRLIKQSLSFLVALAIIVTALPVSAFALSEAEAEDSVFDAAYSFAIGQAAEADVDTDGTTELSSATYTYNSGKMLTGITNPSGTVYGFTYDGFGRTLSVKIGGRTLSTYTYNAKGLPATLTYGNGTTLSYEYDSLNRKVGQSVNGGTRFNYRYDGMSRLSEVIDLVLGKTTKYEYDILGRPTAEKLMDNASKSVLSRIDIRYDDSMNRLAGYDVSVLGAGHSVDYVYNTGDTVRPDLLMGVKYDGVPKLTYTYDSLNRQTARNLNGYVTEYTYLPGKYDGTTSTVIGSVKNGNDTLTYTYDKLGNILSISENGTLIESYTYDSLNQLKTVTRGSDVYVYNYDNGGNILSVTKNGTTVKSYAYTNTEWKDLLTSYNGNSITYDNIGNPTTYHDGSTFTWSDGRKLTGITKGTNSYSYQYDANGYRTSKTVNGVTTQYYWLDGRLYQETNPSYTLRYKYDDKGSKIGFDYVTSTATASYYYVYNLQGDVIAIVDSNNTTVVEYTYNEWGKLTATTGTLATTIGVYNPIRYRGYYYDVETGYYYCKSRYYDPEICRWINADVAYDTKQGVLGYNMYAYCLNNAVSRHDPDGKCSKFLGFLWKIDCKKPSCSTSKNYIKPKSVEPIATYNKGQGYVYIVPESQLDEIMKKKEDNVVVILDDRGAEDPNMQIQDSYEITSKKLQKEICQVMIDYNATNPVEPAWSRTLDSLVFEWRLHNNVYYTGFFHSNTRDCDFNNKDEGKGYWAFFVERVLK